MAASTIEMASNGKIQAIADVDSTAASSSEERVTYSTSRFFIQTLAMQLWKEEMYVEKCVANLVRQVRPVSTENDASFTPARR